MRLDSKKEATRRLALTPTLFGEIRISNSDYLAIPKVSSENRVYIPIGYLDASMIAGDKLFFIPNATKYHFGILTSMMHMAWMRAVAGRLESRYSYSNTVVYNNFIWPTVTEDQKREVERLAQNILNARAEFPNSSLADLYDPLTMPPALSKAHKTLDRYVDRLYQKSGFSGDPARVAHLFELYKEAVI